MPWPAHLRKSKFKALVQERRQSLFTELGPMCRECGETNPELLQFDHVGGWKPQPKKQPNQLTRINELWQDYIAWKEYGIGGPIQVLCEKCNGWDGRQRQQRMKR